MAVRDGVIQRRTHAHNFAILRVNGERAAHAAVGADRIGVNLLRFFPGSRFAHVEFAFEHQRAGGANADAISAVDAGGIGQRNIELGGDVR